MSGHIRAGVVGVGSIGKNHARIYAGLPGVEFSAIHDTNRETGTAISAQYGAKAVFDLSEFAELIDVATVSTPTPDHHETGKFLLRHGKHLLIEKPITETPEQAQELVKLAKERSQQFASLAAVGASRQAARLAASSWVSGCPT